MEKVTFFAKEMKSYVAFIMMYSFKQNWDKEIVKWLGGKLNCLTIDSGSKSEVDRNLTGFMNTYGRRPVNPVLIISYESFRLHANILHRNDIGLVICDEVSFFY